MDKIMLTLDTSYPTRYFQFVGKSKTKGIIKCIFTQDINRVKIADPTSLTAPEVYTITISCTDAEGTNDVNTLTVTTVQNTVPRFVGFIGKDTLFLYFAATVKQTYIYIYIINKGYIR